MTNITATKKGNNLTLEIDLSKENGRSKSGKTIVVATTSGFVWEDIQGVGKVGFSLNVNKKVE